MRARTAYLALPLMFLVAAACSSPNGAPTADGASKGNEALPANGVGTSSRDAGTQSRGSRRAGSVGPMPDVGALDAGALDAATSDDGGKLDAGFTDAGSCDDDGGSCDAHSTCAPAAGSFACTCTPPYMGDGHSCGLGMLALAPTYVDLAAQSTGFRSCADGGDMVSYSVISLTATTATLSSAPAAGCLLVGDDFLIMNLQGTPTASANTGNYELLSVASIEGATVTFSASKTKFYGDGAATDDTNIGTQTNHQRVVLQRVPLYGAVYVAASHTLTATAWNGVKGGVFALTSVGAITIDGMITMDGSGYGGGASISAMSTTGQQGESYAGPGLARTQIATTGGGGGGRGDQTACESYGLAGGGGAYGGSGGSAEDVVCGGAGGASYGDAALTKLFFGSGGGSGGMDNATIDNPPSGFGGGGGGIIFIRAGSVTGAGTISARGMAGEGDLPNVDCSSASTTACWDYSGPGGGGAGGAILVTAQSFSANTDATGGAAGHGWSVTSELAGAGSVGRVKTP